MIVFGHVCTEFRGLVERRRRHCSFLFSATAAFAILADGLLQGHVPAALRATSGSLLLLATTVLMLLSILTALREARLHRGLVFNGVLYQSIVLGSGLAAAHSVARTRHFNPAGVSAVLFSIALLTGTSLLAFVLSAAGIVKALILGMLLLLVTVCAAYYAVQHRSGRLLAESRRSRERTKAVSLDAWHRHLAESIDDAHRDMLELLAMSGLIAFSGFQLLSGLGEARIASLGAISVLSIQEAAATWLAGFMLTATGLSMVAYIRLRSAIGRFSIALDPRDSPFRVTSIDDSFYGFAILAALMSFDFILLLASRNPLLPLVNYGYTAIAALACLVIAERLLMLWFGRRTKH